MPADVSVLIEIFVRPAGGSGISSSAWKIQSSLPASFFTRLSAFKDIPNEDPLLYVCKWREAACWKLGYSCSGPAEICILQNLGQNSRAPIQTSHFIKKQRYSCLDLIKFFLLIHLTATFIFFLSSQSFALKKISSMPQMNERITNKINNFRKAIERFPNPQQHRLYNYVEEYQYCMRTQRWAEHLEHVPDSFHGQAITAILKAACQFFAESRCNRTGQQSNSVGAAYDWNGLMHSGLQAKSF